MDDNSKKTKTMYQPSKLGRKGDPRMHTAVRSRIVNPDLTPLEALQKGGFTFYTAEDGNMYDTDNISVSQRKNQLSRRLRLQKKQMDNEDDCDEVDVVDRGINRGRRTNLPSRREEVDDVFDDNSSNSTKNKKIHKLADSNSQDNGLAQSKSLLFNSLPNDNVTSEFPEPSLVATQPGMHGMFNFKANANATQVPKKRRLSSITVAPVPVQDPRYELALGNFRSDVASLLKKTMINAGFTNVETDECDPAYIFFAQKALDEERERVERIRKRMNPVSVEKNQFGDDSRSHAHSHSNAHSYSNTIAHSHSHASHEKECLHSRHLHRLEGICGHQAIVHKPPGRQPHIDFLVNDKVECYEGCNPMMDSEAFWPSKFSANETDGMLKKNLDLDDCNSNLLTEHQKQVSYLQQQSQCSLIQQQQKQQKQRCEGINCKPPTKDPKVFDLKDIDFDNGEWSQMGSKLDDLFESIDKEEDEKLLGSLFSLKQNGV
jgi:hypothetical protein